MTRRGGPGPLASQLAGALALVRVLMLAAGVCGTLAGCHHQQARAEASVVVERVDAIRALSPADDYGARASAIDTLAKLPLHSDDARSARDACVALERALLEAEQSSELARASLAGAEDAAQDAPAHKETAAAVDRAETALARSKAAVDRAERLGPACRSQLAALRSGL
ncbi:MAG: hypothetical protein KC543_00225 [Myxococcales bacterium]|nr:hypothetical protein [Myxococcales bacterium]